MKHGLVIVALMAIAAAALLGFVVGIHWGNPRTKTDATIAVAPGAEHDPIILTRWPLQDPILEPDRIAFDGLGATYDSFEAVSFRLANMGSAPVYSEFSLMGYVVVLRHLETHDVWEELDSFRCANAGAGNSEALAATAQEAITLNDPWFVDSTFGSDIVRTNLGAPRSTDGKYRIAFRYSLEPPTLASTPVPMYMALSDPFEVRREAESLTEP